jgi:glycosyltransferase involved in cell wall biosynthesis
MFGSTIIPTIGRETLNHAVESILSQRDSGLDWEVIVVNDSGNPLPGFPALREAHVRVIDSHRIERSRARNLGANHAQSKYLHFLDDDDYALPGALRALVTAAEVSGRKFVYGGYETYNSDTGESAVIQPRVAGNIFAHLIAGDAFQISTCLFERGLFIEIGGFDPDLLMREDQDIETRITLREDVAYAEHLVSHIRIGLSGSSSDWSTMAHATRYIREKALRQPGAVERLLSGLHQNPALESRVLRAYGSAIYYGVSQGRFGLLTLPHLMALGQILF